MQRLLTATAFAAILTASASAGEPIFQDRTIFNPNGPGGEYETYEVAGNWIDNLNRSRRGRVRNTRAVSGVRG